MKYGLLAVLAVGLLMPAVAEAGGRDRSKWGFSINIGYSDRGYSRSHYRGSYSHARIDYGHHRDYGRSRYDRPVRYRPAPVYRPPPPVVYYPPPVYRKVEYVYCEPVRPVYVREHYRTYERAYEPSYRYETSITYRSGGYRYR